MKRLTAEELSVFCQMIDLRVTSIRVHKERNRRYDYEVYAPDLPDSKSEVSDFCAYFRKDKEDIFWNWWYQSNEPEKGRLSFSLMPEYETMIRQAVRHYKSTGYKR